jgi:peptidoglycan-associated lipoprotein
MKKLALAFVLGLAILATCPPARAMAAQNLPEDYDHPLRFIAYVAYVPGFVVDRAVLRPLTWLVTRPMVAPIFGAEADLATRPKVKTAPCHQPQAPTVEVATVPKAVEPLPKPEGVPAERRAVPEALSGAQTIYFDYDRNVIRADQLSRMEENLKLLQSRPDLRVKIVGHADERGTTEYNYSLGLRRAQSVEKYLLKNGIQTERVSVESRGEEQPADPGHNADAWAKNRRAEIKSVLTIQAQVEK